MSPSRFLIIVRSSAGQTIAQYDLKLPSSGEPGFNTQVTAFNQFRDAEVARSQIVALKRCTFSEWEWAQQLKIVRDRCKVVRTVWDLFRAIDYDHKTQSYK